MFKYLRTLNAGTVTPEVLELPAGKVSGVVSVIHEGDICSPVAIGTLSTATLTDCKYYALESKEDGDGKTKIKCFRITPGMLFLGHADRNGALDPTPGMGLTITNGNTLTLSGTDGEVLYYLPGEEDNVIFTVR